MIFADPAIDRFGLHSLWTESEKIIVMELDRIHRFPAWAVLCLAVLTTAMANDEWGWMDRAGNRVPDSADMKSAGGFGGWLVVTRDPEWEAEWNTPRDHSPNFATVDEVRMGEVVAILPLFSNPKPDANGIVRIHCDIHITRPDQTVSLNETDLDCFTHRLNSDPRSIWLSAIIPKFVGEPGDPTGKWMVRLVLRDAVREAEVSLETHFILVDE